jgi:dihydrofolate synthase/folylpolyglutamate synthase
MVNDKDITAVLELLPREAQYYFTQANILRALSAEELLQKAQSVGLSGVCFNSVNQAIECAIEQADKNDFVFIGGSNFVVGEALSFYNILIKKF